MRHWHTVTYILIVLLLLPLLPNMLTAMHPSWYLPHICSYASMRDERRRDGHRASCLMGSDGTRSTVKHDLSCVRNS